ncbi:MAG: hypothetical protein K6G61_10975 [Solobacterium sp.]|nr:hypothetical protein [Solobacterium sp.]
MKVFSKSAAVTGDCGMPDAMPVANEKYLPQFRRKIGELKKKGVTIRDEKVRKLCEEGL